MQPQLTDDLLDLIARLDNRLQLAEKALTNDAVQVGTEIFWPASAGELPFNYHIEDGSALDRIGFAALFQLIGTDYGTGDGVTSFNIPNRNYFGFIDNVAFQSFTSNVTISAGTEATANTVVTAPAFTADGTSSYWIEFWTPVLTLPANGACNVWLYLDGSSVGWIYQQYNGASGVATGEPVYAKTLVTPAAGSRTYSIRASQQFGNSTINAGTGGAGNFVPGYVNITTVPTTSGMWVIKTL